jgi:hypothetical protein
MTQYLNKQGGGDSLDVAKFEVSWELSQLVDRLKKDYDWDNVDYVMEKWSKKDLSEEIYRGLLETMAKYWEDKWWSSDNLAVRAMRQFEERLIMPFPEFHKALEYLLWRPVWTHELGINSKWLLQEAKERFADKDRKRLSDDEIYVATIDAMIQLKDYAESNGKKVIEIVTK